jgi:hypothetical protein
MSLPVRILYSASSTGDVATRLFQQKPGMQIFFFRKTSSSAPDVSRAPACFSTKAWYADFLLLKNLTIGSEVSPAGPPLLD